jgi:putative membrane protein
MWERFTPVLLPRVTPAVTRKLRHRGWHEGAGHATGNPVRPAKRPSVTRPGWCPVAEGEPDYRFTLANERTFLAWQRTALGLLLAVLATLTSTMGLLRWEQADRAIRRDGPLPRHPTPAYLAVGLTVVGLLAIGLVIGKAVTG